jgi:hypothetical protein
MKIAVVRGRNLNLRSLTDIADQVDELGLDFLRESRIVIGIDDESNDILLLKDNMGDTELEILLV